MPNCRLLTKNYLGVGVTLMLLKRLLNNSMIYVRQTGLDPIGTVLGYPRLEFRGLDRRAAQSFVIIQGAQVVTPSYDLTDRAYHHSPVFLPEWACQ